MGRLFDRMSGTINAVSLRISGARSSSNLVVPGSISPGGIIGRAKSAESFRHENSITRTSAAGNTNRRSDGSRSKFRQNKITPKATNTSGGYLQVPEITVSGPRTAVSPDSDSASCSSRSRSPSPFDWISRDNLPPGSPTFRRAMEELRSESDFSGEENSDDNSKLDIPAKKEGKGQKKISPRHSSAYRVVRHGTRVSMVKNTKR